MPYDALPTKEIIDQTLLAAKARWTSVQLVQTKEEALDAVKKLLPNQAQVMTGSSVTLEQIGFVDLLKLGQHAWQNLKEAIVAEKDPVKQSALRKQATLSEYFLGSVHALTQDGETLTASATGSQLPSYAYSSPNVIWVVGAQKIVADMQEGLRRIEEYCVPLEDQHMKSLGYSGTNLNKILIFEKETLPNRKIYLILVNEVLGY